MSNKLPNEEIQAALKEVCNYFDKEDRPVRERQLRTWKRLKYYWEGIQKVWWSEVAHDWRIGDRDYNQGTFDDSGFYDKNVNVFRALLETIIAALSVTVPGVYCTPDDADNTLDLQTAKAGNHIAELIYKHNDVMLLWLHALFIYCTEGMIAARSYSKESEEYGTYQKKKYADVEEDVTTSVCPICGGQMDNADVVKQVEDKFAPDDSDVILEDLLADLGPICKNCEQQVQPVTSTSKIKVSRLVGVTSEPKSRQCIEVHGGLFVKVAIYAQKQADTPYLIYSHETHIANILERFPHLSDSLKGSRSKLTSSSAGLYEPYERWARLSTQYLGEYPLNTPTVREFWLRPCSFNILDEERSDLLRKKYPDGAKVVLVNDNFAEACNSKLDDEWTLTHNPLSDYLHHDPLGLLLTSIQDITTEMISLVLQTIEHGIPQTFADPSVLNFAAYSQTEVLPGSIFPAKPASGKAIGDGFYEVKTATLSAEVQPFMDKVQEAGQFVSGALPSLFGGAAPNSSKTAAQYAMSRAQALQRLQTPWKMLSIWWKQIFGKVIPAYIEDVADDEKFVKKDSSGKFVNIFIRKAELQGKIGSVELETSDQLPLTWQQKKDVMMQLLQAANPEIMQALSLPENIPLVAQAIGLNDFVIPGEDDRDKQFEEIQQLLMSEPIETPSINQQTGQPEMQEMPSVPIDPLIDNNEIEAEICRNWAISEAGRLAKVENAPGYKNVLLHHKEHVKAQAMEMQNAAMQSQQPQNERPNVQPVAQVKTNVGSA